GAARRGTRITVRGQTGAMEYHALFFKSGDDLKKSLGAAGGPCGHRTMIQALDAAPENADTLVLDYFPSLLEQIELVTRMGDVKLKRIIFRKASRTHGYFLSSN